MRSSLNAGEDERQTDQPAGPTPQGRSDEPAAVLVPTVEPIMGTHPQKQVSVTETVKTAREKAHDVTDIPLVLQ